MIILSASNAVRRHSSGHCRKTISCWKTTRKTAIPSYRQVQYRNDLRRSIAVTIFIIRYSATSWYTIVLISIIRGTSYRAISIVRYCKRYKFSIISSSKQSNYDITCRSQLYKWKIQREPQPNTSVTPNTSTASSLSSSWSMRYQYYYKLTAFP